MKLILDFRGLLSGFGGGTSDVVVQIIRVVDLEHDLTQTTLALVAVLSFQGTNA